MEDARPSMQVEILPRENGLWRHRKIEIQTYSFRRRFIRTKYVCDASHVALWRHRAWSLESEYERGSDGVLQTWKIHSLRRMQGYDKGHSSVALSRKTVRRPSTKLHGISQSHIQRESKRRFYQCNQRLGRKAWKPGFARNGYSHGAENWCCHFSNNWTRSAGTWQVLCEQNNASCLEMATDYLRNTHAIWYVKTYQASCASRRSNAVGFRRKSFEILQRKRHSCFRFSIFNCKRPQLRWRPLWRWRQPDEKPDFSELSLIVTKSLIHLIWKLVLIKVWWTHLRQYTSATCYISIHKKMLVLVLCSKGLHDPGHFTRTNTRNGLERKLFNSGLCAGLGKNHHRS